MQLKFIAKLLLVFFSLVAIGSLSSQTISDNNSPVVILGNPLRNDGKTGRALNVWDLQVFDGKIYVAGGDTSRNAGPINVWAYNPQQKTFIQEAEVPEEAILQYKVIDNQLYIPAADPRGQDRHKFYRRKLAGDWETFDSNLNLAHVRDLIETDDKLLLVGNSRPATQANKVTQGAVVTDLNQVDFRRVPVNNLPDLGSINFIGFDWFFTVFNYQEKIYATNAMLRDTGNYIGSIAVFDPQKEEFALDFKLGSQEFIPQANIDPQNGKFGIETIYQIWQPKVFQDHLVYTVRSFSVTDRKQLAWQLYFNSLGLYIKSAMGESPQAVVLPHQAVGEDLLLRENELYILANQKNTTGKFTIYIFKTDRLQPQNWQEVLSFSSTNKARSFEYLDRTFYFGLGQDYGEKIGNSGSILSYTMP